jgi:hypothetical protein
MQPHQLDEVLRCPDTLLAAAEARVDDGMEAGLRQQPGRPQSWERAPCGNV